MQSSLIVHICLVFLPDRQETNAPQSRLSLLFLTSFHSFWLASLSIQGTSHAPCACWGVFLPACNMLAAETLICQGLYTPSPGIVLELGRKGKTNG